MAELTEVVRVSRDQEVREVEREQVDVRHMDVGETRTVDTTQTYQLWPPDVYYGSDRDAGEISVDSIDVIPPEREGEYPDIQVTWSADVTKHLGPRWDEHDQPVTDAGRTRRRRSQRLQRWGSVVVGLVAVVVTAVLSSRVMIATLSQITINGQPMRAPTTGEVLTVVLFVVGLAWPIFYGMRRLPGHMGGRR